LILGRKREICNMGLGVYKRKLIEMAGNKRKITGKTVE
jgi:hypothetical protein